MQIYQNMTSLTSFLSSPTMGASADGRSIHRPPSTTTGTFTPHRQGGGGPFVKSRSCMSKQASLFFLIESNESNIYRSNESLYPFGLSTGSTAASFDRASPLSKFWRQSKRKCSPFTGLFSPTQHFFLNPIAFAFGHWFVLASKYLVASTFRQLFASIDSQRVIDKKYEIPLGSSRRPGLRHLRRGLPAHRRPGWCSLPSDQVGTGIVSNSFHGRYW